jgi:siroheme synthase-like protein
MSYYYPVLLDLAGKRCLVIGGRWSAEERVRGLLDAGAQVTVRHPELRPALQPLWSAGRIAWDARDYEAGALDGYFLAVSATHDAELNHRIREEAESRGVLFSAVDDIPNSRFIYPAIHREGDLIVAVSTSGRSPALASWLRDRFAGELGPEYARFLEILGVLRPEVAARFPEFETRKRLWQRIVDSDALGRLRAGDEPAARDIVHSILADADAVKAI